MVSWTAYAFGGGYRFVHRLVLYCATRACRLRRLWRAIYRNCPTLIVFGGYYIQAGFSAVPLFAALPWAVAAPALKDLEGVSGLRSRQLQCQTYAHCDLWTRAVMLFQNINALHSLK